MGEESISSKKERRNPYKVTTNMALRAYTSKSYVGTACVQVQVIGCAFLCSLSFLTLSASKGAGNALDKVV